MSGLQEMWKGARNCNLDGQPILLINIFVDVGSALSPHNLLFLSFVMTPFVDAGVSSESTNGVMKKDRNNILRKRPILLVHLKNKKHNGYAFRINIIQIYQTSTAQINKW